jgi:IMP dehydrogenase
MAYHDLVNAGADAVKVGVGPGAACTTRMVTGFGIPQFSAIYECAQIAEKLRIPLIADGGIRDSRDVVLALAAGASTVMIGKLFALTKESAAPKRQAEGGALEAKYRGQASEDFQTDFYGALKQKTVAEGIDFWGTVSGSADELIEKILGGLRSGMTYGGARSIKELQRKAEFVEVTSNYIKESMTRNK